MASILEKKLSIFGSKPGLRRMRAIMHAFGDPHKRLRVVIVSGTNGKGSTVAFLSAALSASGLKTGSYYSPHVDDPHERILVDGRKISARASARYERMLLRLFSNGVPMTLFEAQTAIAYMYFADKGCDIVVMEVGMGGEFDAVNIADAELSVITTVSLEHTEHLGKTLRAIARTKAGIIRPGSICVTGCAGPALAEIRARCRGVGARLLVLGKDFPVRRLPLSMPGGYQLRNASMALEASHIAGVPARTARTAISKVRLPGRFETVSRRPWIIRDVAHNPQAFSEMLKNLDALRYKRLISIFSVMKDKDWEAMIPPLARSSDVFLCAGLPMGRAEDPSKTYALASRYTYARVFPGPRQALAFARSIYDEGDLILICGSFFIQRHLKVREWG
ncbi:MAG: bifunctional folylpolyglutamate synthase/dihydrofolate synthase [Candidatus Bilamarchaeaceae archaeon]